MPLAFVQETAIALTLWMLFFFAGLALPYLPLLRANAKLKALKKAAAGQNAPTRVVDTAASAFALPKPMGLWTLLPPLVLSLAPIALPVPMYPFPPAENTWKNSHLRKQVRHQSFFCICHKRSKKHMVMVKRCIVFSFSFYTTRKESVRPDYATASIQWH